MHKMSEFGIKGGIGINSGIVTILNYRVMGSTGYQFDLFRTAYKQESRAGTHFEIGYVGGLTYQLKVIDERNNVSDKHTLSLSYLSGSALYKIRQKRPNRQNEYSYLIGAKFLYQLTDNALPLWIKPTTVLLGISGSLWGKTTILGGQRSPAKGMSLFFQIGADVFVNGTMRLAKPYPASVLTAYLYVNFGIGLFKQSGKTFVPQFNKKRHRPKFF